MSEEQLVNGQVNESQVNGYQEINHQEMEVPMAKLQDIVVTDYIREALDKVATAEGFKNYTL
jgi:hypothetical protein